MSTPAAVAQRALEDGQTLALIGENMLMLRTLLSALAYIESGGKRDAARWDGLRKDGPVVDRSKTPEEPREGAEGRVSGG